jgi:hypothetical protein
VRKAENRPAATPPQKNRVTESRVRNTPSSLARRWNITRTVPPPELPLVAVEPADKPDPPPLIAGPVELTIADALRIEIHTTDPSIRIIWFAPSNAQSSAP